MVMYIIENVRILVILHQMKLGLSTRVVIYFIIYGTHSQDGIIANSRGCPY